MKYKILGTLILLKLFLTAQSDSITKGISVLSVSYKISKIWLSKDGKIPVSLSSININYLQDSKFPLFEPRPLRNLNAGKRKVILDKKVRYNNTDTIEVFDWMYAGQGKGNLNTGLYCAKIHLDTLKKQVVFEKKILQFGGVDYDEKTSKLNTSIETFTIRRLNKKELILSSWHILKGEKIYLFYYFKA
jgi:hypothetical protein